VTTAAAEALKEPKFDPTLESLPEAEQNQKRRLQELQGLTGEVQRLLLPL